MEGVIELKYGLPRSKLYSILAASWPQLLKEVVLLSSLEKIYRLLEDDEVQSGTRTFTGAALYRVEVEWHGTSSGARRRP